MPYVVDGLATGILLSIAGILALLRQSLLEPESPNYPKAPTWLRQFMFGQAVVLIFSGLKFVWSVLLRDIPDPGSTSGTVQLLAFALTIYNAAMVCNLLRQRYSVETWERLNKINERLCCKGTPAQRWLSK